MLQTGIKAVLIREGVEAAVVLLYQMLMMLMEELDVKLSPQASPDDSQPDTTTEVK